MMGRADGIAWPPGTSVNIPQKVVSMIRNMLITAATVLCLASTPSSPACGGGYLDLFQDDIQQAIGANQELSRAAVLRLRAAGPRALDALLAYQQNLGLPEAQRDVVKRRFIGELASADDGPTLGRHSTPGASEQDRQRERLFRVIDMVGQQRDCAISKLYWYTDLDKAREEASRTGKPILSLRLLGQLTDEFSCANSRFFRTTLYSNAQISHRLRERFVLHWQSVRPVPQVTIDFGDGRVLKRTLTGNSAHYVLSAEGLPLDVLPGLYGPQTFLRWLQRAQQLAAEHCVSPPDRREDVLRRYHRLCLDGIRSAWQHNLQSVEQTQSRTSSETEFAKLMAIELGSRLTAEAEEFPALEKAELTTTFSDLERRTSVTNWKRIAALHRTDAKLDATSIDLMRREHPTATQAGAVALTKAIVEDPILRLVQRFESSIAADTVRNEYLLHRRIHEWYVTNGVSDEVDQLNDRVYAELFLMPSSDPWLGLRSSQSYTALENDGVVAQSSRR